ncbi:MAG: hypothetical protein WDO56_15935 [Gammaproteobacteria bacterium]
MPKKKPWDYHVDLSPDRLQLLAKVLRDIRRDTLALHDPAGGDTSWSLGCRIYARSTALLVRASDQLWPWLKIVQGNLEFIFQVGAVPLRFFSGDAERPDIGHLRAVEAEVRQLEFAFGETRGDLVWRLVVETDIAGEAGDIVLIGSDSKGDIRCAYPIPRLDDSISIFEPRRSAAKSGIELPPPIVKSRRKAQQKDDDAGSV